MPTAPLHLAGLSQASTKVQAQSKCVCRVPSLTSQLTSSLTVDIREDPLASHPFLLTPTSDKKWSWLLSRQTWSSGYPSLGLASSAMSAPICLSFFFLNNAPWTGVCNLGEGAAEQEIGLVVESKLQIPPSPPHLQGLLNWECRPRLAHFPRPRGHGGLGKQGLRDG